MLRMLQIALLSAACALGAAACKRKGPPETDPSAAEATAGGSTSPDGRKLVCRKERVIGSHQRQKVCRYADDKRRERESLGKEFRSTNASAPPPIE